MAFITLLTDFGHFDEYVGVMKGVILSMNPRARIIDLTHMIDPQDVTQAAYMINATFHYFPKNTVHVVVVDPGVGTDRKVVVLKMDHYYFVAPDNGVLSLLWQDKDIESAVWVNNPRFFLPDISRTFHGRDIFAPVAAWISKKIPMKKLGPPVLASDLTSLSILPAKILPNNTIQGTIISVDRFGNLVTNIEAKTILKFCQKNPDKLPEIRLESACIRGLSSNYQSVPEKNALMIIGSRNYLEIAINGGNASQVFNLQKKDSILISF